MPPADQNARQQNSRVLQLPCDHLGCNRYFKTPAGRTKHKHASHPVITPSKPPCLSSPSPHSPIHASSPVPHSPSSPLFKPEIGTADYEAFEPADEPPPTWSHMIESEFHGPGDKLYRNYHPKLSARLCDESGGFLDTGAPPNPVVTNPKDWAPFDDHVQFETAELLYTHIQLLAPQIDALLDLWGATLLEHNAKPPFDNCRSLYNTIDSILLGDVKWQRFKVQYTGDIPPVNSPPWMRQSYEVWYRDVRKVVHQILGNPSYASEIDLRPFREFATEGDERQYKDFMSGDWAWDQADIIVEDEAMHGSTFVPIILGSDKTAVSVATGNNEFYLLYLSIGNVRNNVRRAHRNALVLLGFLAIPKTTKEHSSDMAFCMFRRQLFHSSLSMILDPLKHAMTSPEVVKFGDGYYRHVIYGLGPYIADYEEQALLACIVRGWCARCQATRKNLDDDALMRCHEFTEALFREACNSLAILWDEYGIVRDLVPFTNDFPRADIHQLIAPDILHQLIKGCFKDHVDWVETYLKTRHGTKEAERILDDIDRRIAAVTPFTGLCHFPQGRGFKQWTGNDSKALMKHYPQLIRLFGAPNGLCSSITECKHIKAVKEPYRHSNKYNAIGQMLLTNQCLDKLANCRIDFTSRGMLEGTCLSAKLQTLQFLVPAFNMPSVDGAPQIISESQNPPPASTQADDDEGVPDDLPMNLSGHVELARTRQRKRARTIEALAIEIAVPNLPSLLSHFLFYQQYPDDSREASEIPITDCPHFEGSISVFNSASVQFYAPSDLSGLSAPLWRNEAPQYDCVFVGTNVSDPSETGMRAYDIARVFAFFAFKYKGIHYPCAVIRWFDKIGDSPDEDTGMWMVRPSFLPSGSPNFSIIHTDAIYRAAHLIPVYGNQLIPHDIRPHHSYDVFHTFYVNKYADHHMFEIAG
ncbi:hypothetical protein PISMIDRAFT_12004 [Pisolithus microcarpus 441]|uniref:C2H2-type domain-containing protein n=1 Tax=Pisolithus microcarpus 441 TaxID=765257 RepID=A0A0C9YAT8_9AGAM|nr:hypothetical protein PISMIDRAFT_12004 [Pisolithus microcarpus 441]